MLKVCNDYITGNPSPAVQVPSRAQFMHTGHRTLHVRAKGGWGHVRAAGGAAHRGASIDRRPTRFARPVPARRARPGPRSPSRAAISPSSEGLSGPHHADKTNFSGGGPPQGFSHSVQGQGRRHPEMGKTATTELFGYRFSGNPSAGGQADRVPCQPWPLGGRISQILSLIASLTHGPFAAEGAGEAFRPPQSDCSPLGATR